MLSLLKSCRLAAAAGLIFYSIEQGHLECLVRNFVVHCLQSCVVLCFLSSCWFKIFQCLSSLAIDI